MAQNRLNADWIKLEVWQGGSRVSFWYDESRLAVLTLMSGCESAAKFDTKAEFDASLASMRAVAR